MRGWAASTAALLAAANALAADAPAIRDFDIVTIETFGRHIYRQDQSAWKASDVLHAAVVRGDIKTDTARGWIVSERSDGDVVRFVRVVAGVPQSYYDVTVDAAGAHDGGPPKDPALTADEIAQWKARMLALANFDFRCTEGTPNSVAFREADGHWLVWVLSASAKPDDLVLAGHMRFTISPDGNTLIKADKLSKGCLVSTREPPRPDYTPVGAVFSNVVSLKPLETQVFTSLNYQTVLYVGTLDGLAWKIDAGRVAMIEQDAAAPDGDVARRLFGLHEACVTLVGNVADGSDIHVGATATVIEQTEGSGPVAFPAPPGQRVVSLLCHRLDIVPSPNDYKLIKAGYGLYIEDRGETHPERSLVLWFESGRVAWRLEEGPPLTPELRARIEKRADQFQKAITAQP